MKTITKPFQWKEGNIPTVLIRYALDMKGRVTLSTQTVGELETQVHTKYDEAGRIISQTDVAGLSSSYTYSDGGLTVAVTTPAGATFISRRHTDGSLLEESGTGRESRYYSYHIHPLGIMTRVRLENPDDGAIVSETVIDVLGRTRIVRVPGGNATMQEERHIYDSKGKLVKTERSGRPDLLYEYDAVGNLIRQIEKMSGNECIDASVDRIVTYEYGRCQVNRMNSALLQNLLNVIGDTLGKEQMPLTGTDLVFRRIVKTYVQYGGEGQNVTETSFDLVSDTRRNLMNISLMIDKYGREELGYTLKEGMVEIDCIHTGSWENMAWKARIGNMLLSEGDKSCMPSYYDYKRTSSTQIQTVTDSRGNATAIMFDRAGRTLRVTDATGTDIETNWYDPETGFLVKTTNALGGDTLFSYDERGRKRSEYGTAVHPVCYHYDDADRLIRFETFRSDDMTAGENPLGRMDGDTTNWTYDERTGLVLEKSYADGSKDSFLYDNLGRLEQKHLASGRTVTFTYQPGIDNPATVAYAFENEEAGILTERTYDHWGRVTTVDHHDMNRVAYSYKTGLLHDAHGDLQSEAVAHEYMDVASGVIYSIAYANTYTRDTQGRRNGYAVSLAGGNLLSVNVEHDSMDRIVAVTQNGKQKFEFGYNTVTGAKERITYPNGIVKTMTLEEKRDYLSGIDYRKPGMAEGVFTQHMSYDIEGRLIGETRQSVGVEADTRNYTYNTRSELTDYVSSRGGSRTWSYDSAGNRKTALQGDSRTNYESNNLNQYQSVLHSQEGDYSPTYDPDGNQLTVRTGTGIWQVVYGPDGRPESYSSGGITSKLIHDDRNRMMIKLDANGGDEHHKAILNYYIGEQLIFQGDYDISLGDIVINRSYLWDPTENTSFRPLAMNRYGLPVTFGSESIDIDLIETSYYLHDHNKNVVALIDEDGAKQAVYEYDPYGNLNVESGELVSLNPFRFSSEHHDHATGLIDYLYRSYNPKEGRWTQRDPITERGGVNLYRFVNNTPNHQFDYLGLAPKEDGPMTLNEKCRNALFEKIREVSFILREKFKKTTQKNETGFYICCKDGKMFTTNITEGAPKYIALGFFAPMNPEKGRRCPPNSRTLALLHIHPQGLPYPLSDADIDQANNEKKKQNQELMVPYGSYIVSMGPDMPQEDRESLELYKDIVDRINNKGKVSASERKFKKDYEKKIV